MARGIKTSAAEAAKSYLTSDESKAKRPMVGSPESIWAILKTEVSQAEQECFWVFALNIRNSLLGYELIGKGSVAGVDIHPRDVFRYAVRINAAAIVIAHNHPSGDTTPSSEDIELTRRLKAAGQLLGVPVIDHVVLSGSGYTSFAETRADF